MLVYTSYENLLLDLAVTNLKYWYIKDEKILLNKFDVLMQRFNQMQARNSTIWFNAVVLKIVHVQCV